MWWEIVVSIKGKHFFATHPRSLTTRNDMEFAVGIFRKKFPKKEGFEITIIRHEEYIIDIGEHYGF